ncbi:hypothetical protein T05_844 [Trichinella murrelli]|uniref:Uncharacterized protein n=1 Tax=Trichinella murrelli TaxID=144512 RepID=A0A0V0T936_9BILA|nr:hypothetical protein T05_844 [Trichinella murrelli]
MIQVISQLLMNHRTSYLRTANCGILADEFRTLIIRLSFAEKRLSVNAKRTRSVSYNQVLRSEIYAVCLRESDGNFVANKSVLLKRRLDITYLDLEDQEDFLVRVLMRSIM